jgi:ribosomal protein S27AE
MPAITVHDVATSTYPIGVECSHCIRHVLIRPGTIGARHGDTRTLEEAGLYCGKCGSRDFTATRFHKRSAALSFVRNH